MRILLDTNILVSGILVRGGPPALLLQAWRSGQVELVTSDVQTEELRRVLDRPKIARRLEPGEAELLVESLEQAALCAHDLPVVDVSPDQDDNRILATAIGGVARSRKEEDRAG